MSFTKIVAFIIGLFFATLSLIRLAIQYVFNPKMFKRVERQAPACLTDNRYGEHGYVTTASNIKFHYVSKGDESKPLMLFVHGFPEFWYSWRHQLSGIDIDYRLVAMDLRGYGDSDKPQGLAHYKTNLLVKDIKEFIEALGHSSCVLVAHDWGAVLAWHVAHEYSQVVDKLVIMNGPHPVGYKKFLAKSWTQKKKSWYAAFFQVPYVPELLIQANDFKALDMTFRSSDHMGVKKEGSFTDEDIEAFKYTLGQPGALTPPLNYYRNALDSYQTLGTWKKKISCPVMVIWGLDDNALDPGNLDYMSDYAADLTMRKIAGVSHWVQQEEPDLVNTYITEFVTNK